METRNIILVRHGESTANRERTLTGRTDPELTARGRSQARRASRYITGRYAVDLLYTSPLKRAVNTASRIARRARAHLVTDDLLMETDFGSWEGLRREELAAKRGWEEYLNDPFHFRFPGGESPQDVKERMHLFKRKILADGNWRGIVVVSHYTPIVFFLLDVLGGGDAAKAPFRVDNASLSVIEVGEGYTLLSLVNFTP